MEGYFKAIRHLISLMGHTDGWSIVDPGTLRYGTDDKSFTVSVTETVHTCEMNWYGHGFDLDLPYGMMAYFQPLKDALNSGKQGEVVMDLGLTGRYSDEASNFLVDFS